MMIPEWANNVLIEKGIGFESKEVKGAVWGFFESQFSSVDCDQRMRIMYFSHVVDELIKNGDVDKARAAFGCSSYIPTRHSRQLKAFERKPLKQDAVEEFEEKFRNYMKKM